MADARHDEAISEAVAMVTHRPERIAELLPINMPRTVRIRYADGGTVDVAVELRATVING